MTHNTIFATSNKGKALALKKLSANFGIEITQVELELIEPQADSVVEVAQNKALQAVNLLGKPVVVEDSGFVIDALAGFPGAYTKYIMSTIGADGLLRLAAPYPQATCHFVSAMCYATPDGIRRTFVDNSAEGILADSLDSHQQPDAWSELWRIFIPKGYDKPLSAFTPDEQNTLMQHWQASSVYGQFVRWLASELKLNVL